MMTRFDRLEAGQPITSDGQGPSISFQWWAQKLLEQVESALTAIEQVNEAQQVAIEAIQAAQAAADAANAAAAAADAAAANAAVEAAAATAAAASANDTIAQIEDGTLDLSAVKIGGTRFINNAGTLEPEP